MLRKCKLSNDINYMMHKDVEEMEALSQSAVRDEGLHVKMLHRKSLVSGLAVFA